MGIRMSAIHLAGVAALTGIGLGVVTHARITDGPARQGQEPGYVNTLHARMALGAAFGATMLMVPGVMGLDAVAYGAVGLAAFSAAMLVGMVLTPNER